MKIREIERLTGKKLTLKQKIAFLILKHQSKHRIDDKQSPGQTAFIFGLGALALLVIGLFVPYVILGSLVASILAIVVGSTALKRDPTDHKARMGKLLGWITLGVTLVIAIIAAIVIAAFFSSFKI
jgi:MFS family permease